MNIKHLPRQLLRSASASIAIVVLGLGGVEAQMVFAPRPSLVTEVFDGTLSPDGTHVLSNIPGGFAAYDLNEKRYSAVVEELPHDDGPSPAFATSGQGKTIILRWVQNQTAQYWLFDTGTQSFRRLFPFPNLGNIPSKAQLTVSLDGRFIAFLTKARLGLGDWNLLTDAYIIDTRNGNMRLASVGQNGLAMGHVGAITFNDQAKLVFQSGAEIRRFRPYNRDSLRELDLDVGQGDQPIENVSIARSGRAALFSIGEDGDFLLARRNQPIEAIVAPNSNCTPEDGALSRFGRFVVASWACDDPVTGHTAGRINEMIDILNHERSRLRTDSELTPQLSDNGMVLVYTGGDVPWVYRREAGRSELLRLNK